MKDDKFNVVKGWFKKAENDLKSAEYLMTMDAPPFDMICFHAQQCAEKYLKGFLAFYETYFPKTHSIEDLVSLCKEVAPSIETDLMGVEALSNYGVEIRYPDDIYYEIPKDDAVEAIELANKVKTTILKLLYDKI